MKKRWIKKSENKEIMLNLNLLGVKDLVTN